MAGVVSGRMFWIFGVLMVNFSESIILFDFDNPPSHNAWRVVNDDVMGGVSRSRLDLGKGAASFTGALSLENNGGFASVRTPRLNSDLTGYQGFQIRVKGDGKIYKFRVRTDQRMDGVAYSVDFTTKPDQWETITLRADQFVPMFRGRMVRGLPDLDLGDAQQLGFLISDGQEGSFCLEIAEIRAFKVR